MFMCKNVFKYLRVTAYVVLMYFGYLMLQIKGLWTAHKPTRCSEIPVTKSVNPWMRMTGGEMRFQHFTLDEPIDIVYTWVNGSDKKHREMVEKLQKQTGSESLTPNRFEPWNNLLYSLRSVEKFANWTRHIFIVTNGQVPHWLNLQNPDVTLVTHEEIFLNQSHLPTFASPAIESHIHRIKGLSRRFVYMNDDIFFSSPTSLNDFYTTSDGYKIRVEGRDLPSCTKRCAPDNVNDGKCNVGCLVKECEWDGDDCPDMKGKREKIHIVDDTTVWFFSMLHTNYQLNRLFGPRRRYMPVHAPMFIDKEIMHEIQSRLQKEWDFTSSCRVKHPHSIQLPFVYYNYLLELSYQNPPRLKVKRTRIEDAEMFFLTHVNESLSAFAYKLKTQKIKFLNMADNIVQPLSAKVEADLRQKLEEFFHALYPVPSKYETL